MKYKVMIILTILLFICSATCSIIGFLYAKTISSVEQGFYLNGEDEITLEYGEKYEEDGFMAMINNRSLVDTVTIESNININKIGNYEISYYLNYHNYEKVLTRKVNIIDTQSPVLDIKCDTETYIPVNGKVDCKISANDNYDQDITDKIVVDTDLNTKKVGNYKITYSVSDSSKNEVIKTILVHVRNKNDITYVNVSIEKQKLEYYQNNKLVLSTPITSGAYNATRKGDFKIVNKARNTYLYGAGYASFVEYWMGYGGAYGLHDASWRKKFGTQDYYYNGSHGCVNMPRAAAQKLYSMIEVGTPVYIK